MTSGEQTILKGLAWQKITATFPRYSLKAGDENIRNRCQLNREDELVSCLPKTPSILEGGDVDIIIGSQYMRYFPKIVFELDTGSRILESKFVSTFLFFDPRSTHLEWSNEHLALQTWDFFRKYLISGNLCSELSQILQFSCSFETISENSENF